MSQYIVYLRYMGQYLRTVVWQFLHGNFTLPSYDFSIGMGDDIGQIVRFHPLDFLSVFVPAAFSEILYEVILILRFYLAGLAFSMYAFSWNSTPSDTGVAGGSGDVSVHRVSAVNVLSGALVYVFCGFMLIRVVNHPTYAAPFIVLPLLLLGAERAMHGRGYSLFIFSVFLGFWSNYYFMYIMSAGLLAYMLARFPEVYQKQRIKNFFTLLVKMVLAYLLGLAMSMITLCPMLLRYLSSSRTPQNTVVDNLLIYADKRRYIAWILNLISPFQSSGNGTDLNFAVIVLPCLVLLFSMAWKKFRSLKLMFIGCILILLIPAAGYILAFFNRENNRWIFLLALCCGMAVVFTADLFARLSRSQIRSLLFAAGGFVLLVVLQSVLDERNLYNITAAVELVVCMAILLSPQVRKGGVIVVRRCVLIITCVSTLINGFMTFEPGLGGLTQDYVDAGKVASTYESVQRTKGALTIQDDSFYRIEGYNVKHGTENSSIYSDYNSTSEYNSILNARMLEAMISQNNQGLTSITTMKGLDARSVAMNLAHVKYFVTRPSYAACVPYGFSKEPVSAGRKTAVYACENPLSFGYSSNAFITRENYNKLSDLEKEMVQLEAVVAEPVDGSDNDLADQLRSAGLEEIEKPSVSIEREAVSLVPEGGGIRLEDDVIHAKKNAKMSFVWKKRSGYDAYVLFSGFRPSIAQAYLRLKTGDFTVKADITNENHLYYTGKEDYLIHMGYSDTDAEQTAVLTFRTPCDYQLSSAEILYVPMEGYEEKIDRLNADSLENESISDGRVTGTINLSSPKILVLSVPQAKGWTVKVDGERVSEFGAGESDTGLLTANVMYQGIFLPEGEHSIEMTYATPGSALGYAAAIPAILVFLVLLIMERRRTKKALHPVV